MSSDMSNSAVMTWCRRHPGPLLVGASIVLMALLVRTGGGGRKLDLGNLALVVAVALPLLVRERRPMPVLLLVAVLDAVRAVASGHNDPASSTLPIATIVGCYTVGDLCAPRVAWLGAVAAASAQFVIVTIHFHGTGPALLYYNWALMGTAVGSLTAERRRRLAAAEQRAMDAERTKEEEALRRVTAERVRIARELHDSLAHHITVVNAQASVAQYLLRENPEAAKTALSGIVGNTRAALDELRATLGLLRDEPSSSTEDPDRTPTPGLGQLQALLTRMRSTGMTVTMDIAGDEQPLSAVSDLAAYRIIQEALSNAARHAPGSAVSLSLRWTRADLTVTIVNAEASPRGSGIEVSSEGAGYGLIGMRERATAAGGRFNVGPTPQGCFVVVAVLPTERHRDVNDVDVSQAVQS